MEELLAKFLKGTLNTAVQAGITSLITDVDFEDAFKGQAALNVGSALLSGGSPLDIFKNKQPAAGPAAQVSGGVKDVASGGANASLINIPGMKAEKTGGATQTYGATSAAAQPAQAAQAPQNLSVSKLSPITDNRGFLESMGDVVSGDGGRMAALKQAFMPDASGNPDMLRKYGPLMGAGIAGLYAAGAFDPVEQQQVQQFGGITGQDLLTQNPGRYRIGVPAIARGYAKGGDIDPSAFPRRNGGISGPGTGTSDDIPAMLSDGEFVMTAKAVEGMGNGSREQGIRNMYQMMNGLESRMA